MKKTLLAATIVALTSVCSSAAFADTLDFVVGARLGVSQVSEDFSGEPVSVSDNSLNFRPYAGLQFNATDTIGFRTEVEYFHIENFDFKFAGQKIGSGHLDGGLLSESLVFIPNEAVSPYLGIGLGYTKLSLSDTWDGDNEEGMTYAAFGGVDLNIATNVSLDLQGRYTEYRGDIELKSTDFMFGVKFKF